MHKLNQPRPLYQARCALRLTTAEAAQYVEVTRETWEAWEAGEMLGKAAPQEKFELFIRKLDAIGKSRDMSPMVVVCFQDPTFGQQPIGVVSKENYLGLENGNIIKSMAVHNGHPYVHRTKFDPEHNPHVIKFCNEQTPA